MPCDVLVVAAFDPELEPLRNALGEAGRAGRAVSVGELSVVASVVGIGLPMAAVGAATSLSENEPRSVVAIGTCGAYVGTGFAIGDVVVATEVQLVDSSAVDGASQFPARMDLVCQTDAALSRALQRAGALPARLATTLAITVDDLAAERIAHATGAQVEHLEAHGVATACAAKGVPFGAVFGVANYVGARARDEWRDHHVRAAVAAAEVVSRWLRSGDPR